MAIRVDAVVAREFRVRWAYIGKKIATGFLALRFAGKVSAYPPKFSINSSNEPKLGVELSCHSSQSPRKRASMCWLNHS